MLQAEFDTDSWEILTRQFPASSEQIIAVLKEGEAGIKVANLFRKYGMSEATYHKLEYKIRQPHRLK